MQHFTQKKFHVDCETKAGNAVLDHPKRKISSASQKHADNCRWIDVCIGQAWRSGGRRLRYGGPRTGTKGSDGSRYG